MHFVYVRACVNLERHSFARHSSCEEAILDFQQRASRFGFNPDQDLHLVDFSAGPGSSARDFWTVGLFSSHFLSAETLESLEGLENINATDSELSKVHRCTDLGQTTDLAEVGPCAEVGDKDVHRRRQHEGTKACNLE